jgi:SAM-dependent methyltransferase
MRPYRANHSDYGQVSPIHVADLVQPHLIGRRFADIGCGAGVPVSILRARWPSSPSFLVDGERDPIFIGIDHSPGAVAYTSRYGAFDEVILADSSTIPLADDHVDTALCLENLEHLYPADIRPAIEELVRISARRVIITSPWPWNVIAVEWTTNELRESRRDPDPMDADEYKILAGYIHKSCLEPANLEEAGFRICSVRDEAAAVYVGDVDSIDLGSIGAFFGLDDKVVEDPTADHRVAYTDLLERSLDMHRSMAGRPRIWDAKLAADGLRMTFMATRRAIFGGT